MKKLFLSIMLTFTVILLYGQTGPVEEMFSKYSEREGFTVISISSKMLGMFSAQDEGKKEAGDIINRLKSIKILSVEDSLLNQSINFYTELSRKMNMSDYEELMVIREGKDVTKFLIRQKGDLITELLVISGGPGGNSLISIKGDLDLKSISELSKNVGIEELENLDKVESREK